MPLESISRKFCSPMKPRQTENLCVSSDYLAAALMIFFENGYCDQINQFYDFDEAYLEVQKLEYHKYLDRRFGNIFIECAKQRCQDIETGRVQIPQEITDLINNAFSEIREFELENKLTGGKGTIKFVIEHSIKESENSSPFSSDYLPIFVRVWLIYQWLNEKRHREFVDSLKNYWTPNRVLDIRQKDVVVCREINDKEIVITSQTHPITMVFDLSKPEARRDLGVTFTANHVYLITYVVDVTRSSSLGQKDVLIQFASHPCIHYRYGSLNDRYVSEDTQRIVPKSIDNRPPVSTDQAI